VDQIVSWVTGEGGSWSLTGLVSLILVLMLKGRLVPRSCVPRSYMAERLAGKQQIVDFQRETIEKATAALEKRELLTVEQGRELTKALTAFNGSAAP